MSSLIGIGWIVLALYSIATYQIYGFELELMGLS